MTYPAAATAPSVPGAGAENWLDFEHPEYAARKAQWAYALDHYTGEVLLEGKVRTYLIRRGVGEPVKSYEERVKLADYKNHFGTVVDSLAGMLFANEEDADRVFAREKEVGLGDEDDARTVAGRLMLDANGRGTGWKTLHKQLATTLSVVHCGWGLVTAPNGAQRVRYLSPLEVPDWEYDETGRLVRAKVREEVVLRGDGLQGKAAARHRWVVYDVQGWQRWEKSKETNSQPVQLQGDDHRGVYKFVDRDGGLALPIYPIHLPLKRMVGWLLSRNANAIFNLESARDFLLWAANFPKLKLAAGDVLFDKLVIEIGDGANIIQDDPAAGDKTHDYIAPPTGPAEMATKVIDKKIVDFYITAFREYGDAARERTATEARQDVAAGVGAYLQMLKAALDDAENNALWRIEQIEWPDTPAKWFGASVERSDEFMPMDVHALIDRLTARYFGKDTPVPVGRTGQIAVAKMIASFEGLEVADEELQGAVDFANLAKALDAKRELEVPATARVALVMRLCEVLGVIPAKKAEPQAQLRGQIEQGATRLAEAADENAARMAELGGSLNTPDVPPSEADQGRGGFLVERDDAGRMSRLVRE